MLRIAIPLNLLGITCFTGVPGAALTLWAWSRADDEMARVANGALPAERATEVAALRNHCFGWMVFATMSLAAQLLLIGTGSYGPLFSLLGSLTR